METIRLRVSSRRRRRRRGAAGFILLVLVGAVIGAWIGWNQLAPNKKHVSPDYGSGFALFYEGNPLDKHALMDGSELKLPLSAIQDVMGDSSPIPYEDESGSIILTTANHVLRMKTDELTATLNRKPYELRVAAETQEDEVYLPVEPLKQLYGLQAEYKPGSGTVTLLQAGDTVERVKPKNVKKGVPIRTKPSIKAPIVEQVTGTGVLRLWREENKKWLYVQGPDGAVGYVKAADVTTAETETVPVPDQPEPFEAPKLTGGQINLTWEAVYNNPINTASIGDMPGVNVVSPTWFELKNGDGDIISKADARYVKWAHNRGMHVWALFSNGFEPERTAKALASVDTRFKMIQQLLAFAQLYDLQGINVDFENVNLSDKANVVQFVRELTPLLHEQGLVVSIDVTPKGGSDTWSNFLDRQALGQTVDYMMLMAYDEHWASSPKAGSVASLGWTEKSLARILDEDGVPPEKMVLAMPLYTRVWTEKDGKVSSKAIGMEKAASLLKEKKLTPTFDQAAGQHYVEFEEDGGRKRIWLEDETSLKARVALVHKYKLAGVATWQRAFQGGNVWSTIDGALKGQPKS
ncbi:glycosyl hydrolase family 18 protein [Paenibacillus xylaniclasticus]|uniref:glycosyl hydrolase family 18 protein n=1 Tax=Paenibacillus xylaniclasticus TaxID=588083 RepID=UPI000FD6C38D|nr:MULTISPECIES: glycosyl hydrolase family 18 protein [Paenibacillus]GFN29745.1 hypothetical protein PCURB6_00050 [Paenibacillus curdlanolyticus]